MITNINDYPSGFTKFININKHYNSITNLSISDLYPKIRCIKISEFDYIDTDALYTRGSENVSIKRKH